jgi:hypothetical protein
MIFIRPTMQLELAGWLASDTGYGTVAFCISAPAPTKRPIPYLSCATHCHDWVSYVR